MKTYTIEIVYPDGRREEPDPTKFWSITAPVGVAGHYRVADENDTESPFGYVGQCEFKEVDMRKELTDLRSTVQELEADKLRLLKEVEKLHNKRPTALECLNQLKEIIG